MRVKSFQTLVEHLKKFPAVGNKTAQRYALKILQMSDKEVEEMAQALLLAKKMIKPCTCCGNYTESDLCDICMDELRQNDVICVVTHPMDIDAIERTQTFFGQYHVLGGLISPIHHVFPSDLNIDSLTKRIDQGDIKEVILALSATIEGETTALYLAKLYEHKTQLTHLAMGLPMGSSLEYVDEITLVRSINNRKKIEI